MSASYGWIITKDHIAIDAIESDAGTMGPATIPYRIVERLKSGEGRKFRMYDDDNILYYEGLVLGNYDELYGGDPLMDFGMPNAGCTRYQEYINGKWVDIIG